MKLIEVWGIPVWLHFSWFLVFGLVTWSLASGYFPEEYPGWAGATYWLVGALTAVAFFGSVLVHELGHSWVALRHGLPIRSITLFVFGGVAQIGREPEAPGVEFKIAIAGPLTSFALALIFGSLWLLGLDILPLAAAAIWLARINLMVAAFNLVPGFPLDGGRIFRALVWRWSGSFRRASRAAVTVGQLVALGLVGLGVLGMLRGDPLGGMWLVLIGWFLQNAARASQAEATLRELLRDATVRQAMTRECRRVERGSTLEQLVEEEVLGAGRRCFVVTDDGRLRGLLTLHEVKAVPRERWPKITVGEVMKPAAQVRAVSPHDDLLSALQKMDDAGVGQLPVVAGEELMGMIGREQILHYVRARTELGV